MFLAMMNFSLNAARHKARWEMDEKRCAWHQIWDQCRGVMRACEFGIDVHKGGVCMPDKTGEVATETTHQRSNAYSMTMLIQLFPVANVVKIDILHYFFVLKNNLNSWLQLEKVQKNSFKIKAVPNPWQPLAKTPNHRHGQTRPMPPAHASSTGGGMRKREGGKEHGGRANDAATSCAGRYADMPHGPEMGGDTAQKHAISCAWKIAKNDNGRESGL
jgi:hypothetical protein